MSVAILGLVENRTFLATVSGGYIDTADAVLSAGTASNSASGPNAPFGHDTVDRTVLTVAGLGIVEGGASRTTISHVGDDRARAGLDASATGE